MNLIVAQLIQERTTNSIPKRPSRWRVWVQAIRPFSFTASVMPILVATALAIRDGGADPVLVTFMLLAAVACHAGANLANDYYDHVKGIDSDVSLGPSKVIQQGLLTPAAVRMGMVVSFAVATALGTIIVLLTNWVVLGLALASLAAAYFYTGGPRPLGYIALGELTVFIFMGPVMIGGAFYVLTGRVAAEVLVAATAIGLLVAAILHANNMRDVDLDRAAGKKTMATLFGAGVAAWEYVALVLGAYLSIGLLPFLESRYWPVLVTVVSLPVARRLARLALSSRDPEVLNRLLRGTAGLHLRVGALLSLGLLLTAAVDHFG
ncbi:MAG: 1,4-dihydroxy-2-naphthoate octaprenyltransferase [Chloroflexota bacterium]|nr:1,4-dihydroxy-2-naphthoate octaprenyltransferase [Chloroflexota bacterium]